MIPTEELAAWLAGEADPAVAARVESAIAEDPDVAARVAALRRLDDLLAAVPAAAPSDEAAGRIAAAAMASARDVLDAEEANASSAEGARAAGRGLVGAGAAPPGGQPGAGRAAGDSGPVGRRGAAGWSDGLTWSNLWSSWTGRALAAAATVALVAAGVLTIGPGGLLGGDDSVEMSFSDAGEDERGADAALDESMEESGVEDSTDLAAAEELEAATESAAGPAAATSSVAASWAELVDASQPHLVATSQGDVVMLDVGQGLDTFTIGPGAGVTEQPPVDDGEEFLSPAIITEWLRVTLPDADGLAPGEAVADDGLVTEPEADRVRECLAARASDAAASLPSVVVALVGSVSMVPGTDDPIRRDALALVDEEATVDLRDAATCLPIDE